MKKGNHIIEFETNSRFKQYNKIAIVNTKSSTQMNSQKTHVLLGNNDKETVQETEKVLRWTITQGTLNPCNVSASMKISRKISTSKGQARMQACQIGICTWIKQRQ